MGKNILSLDTFKNMVSTNEEFKTQIIGRHDIVDFEHGIMRICSENLNKYLDEYLPKFNENYELLENIGSGSAGYVYKGKTKNPKNMQLFFYHTQLQNFHESTN